MSCEDHPKTFEHIVIAEHGGDVRAACRTIGVQDTEEHQIGELLAGNISPDHWPNALRSIAAGIGEDVRELFPPALYLRRAFKYLSDTPGYKLLHEKFGLRQTRRISEKTLFSLCLQSGLSNSDYGLLQQYAKAIHKPSITSPACQRFAAVFGMSVTELFPDIASQESVPEYRSLYESPTYAALAEKFGLGPHSGGETFTGLLFRHGFSVSETHHFAKALKGEVLFTRSLKLCKRIAAALGISLEQLFPASAYGDVDPQRTPFSLRSLNIDDIPEAQAKIATAETRPADTEYEEREEGTLKEGLCQELLRHLDRRSRDMLQMRLKFFGEDLSKLDAIADAFKPLSRERVRQICDAAITKLRLIAERSPAIQKSAARFDMATKDGRPAARSSL